MRSAKAKRKPRPPRTRRNEAALAQAVYDAEWEAFPKRPHQDFSSLRGVRAFVDEVLASPVWHEIKGPARVEVKDNGDRDCSEAHGPVRPEIWIARGMYDRETVLHELAHAAGGQGHGSDFIKAFLVLVAHFMGFHYHDRLAKALGRRDIF